MNDEPGGLMNLEDDAPETPVVPAVADSTVVAAPDAPVVPAVTEQEVQAAGGDRERAGLLAALRAERDTSKTLKDRAALADTYAQQLADARPYVEFLRANPHLMTPRAAEPPPAPKEADPDAVEAAQLMDFYKPDGQLDVDKGAKYLALQDRRAGRVTQEAVRPYREQSLQEKSAQNFALALGLKDPQGNSPSREALNTVWKTLSVEDTANVEIAATLAMLAMGADRMMGKAPAARPAAAPIPAPLVTEGSGGHQAAPGALSRLEEGIVQHRGMTAAKWAEHTAGFQPGRSNVLED